MKKKSEFMKISARELRSNMTEQEKKLWYKHLRNYPVRIYRQKIIGRFIVDFYCASAKVVIEIDGSQHYTDDGMIRDEIRTDMLEDKGLIVIRFTNDEVDFKFNYVCSAIDNLIRSRIM